MPSFFERVRNVFRNELVVPAPQKTAQEVEMESQREQAKMDEGYRMGAATVVADVAGYLQESRMELSKVWAHDLAHGHKKHAVLDERFMAVLAEQNGLARYLNNYSKESRLSPELAPEVVDVNVERDLAHKDAAYQQQAEWVQEMEPDNHIGNEPGQSMHDTLAERWTRDLLRSPEDKEAIADRYMQAVEKHNQEAERLLPWAPFPKVDFAQLQREVLGDVQVRIMESHVETSEVDRPAFNAKYASLWEKYSIAEEPAQPSRGMEAPGQSAEVLPNRYEYLDVAIQQLSQANSATVAREISQSGAVSQPQQSVFIQSERAQQVALETPEAQRDFGVSL